MTGAHTHSTHGTHAHTRTHTRLHRREHRLELVLRHVHKLARALVGGGVFGMEMWARWAHKALWHDFEPGWSLHKSHHEPRVGPFEVRAG